MTDDILIKYGADFSGITKAGAAVQDVTDKVETSHKAIKATFSDKSIEEATRKLYEQGDVMGALIERYGDAGKALKAMQKELDTMAALGQRGTKQFTELANATAELKDTIGDTRGEIKKMASDTRVFDTMLQGARGVAAAFSIAEGAAAALGDENKDLQKTLLKVQGAMAVLQGAQELANLATEKGGIATKAYGVALRVVDAISKATGLSMAASWALATGGITILIAAATTLYFWLQKNADASEELAQQEEERQKLYEKTVTEGQKKSYAKVMEVQKEFDRNQDRRLKQSILNNEDTDRVELGLLRDKIAQSEKVLRDFNLVKVFLNEQDASTYKKYLEDRILDAEVAAKKLSDKLYRDRNLKPVENITPITTVEPLVTKDVVDMNKRNAEQMNKDLRLYAYEKSIKDQEEYNAKRLQLENELTTQIYSLAQQANQALFEFINIGYENQLATSNDTKQKELAAAGDNAEKKKKIEQKFAIEQAKIKRQQAIAEKASALFGIGIQLAQTIQKITAEAAVLSSNPVTAALAGNAYAQLGVAIASAALQAGVVAAKPLPEIPKFEKGGAVVLAGGRMDDGHLFGRSHRQGGILIEAQGGEYMWDVPTVKQHGDLIQAAHENRIEDLILHKYIAPAMAQAQSAGRGKDESYDDFMLRATIKQGHEKDRKNAEYIADKVSSAVTSSAYNQNRYK